MSIRILAAFLSILTLEGCFSSSSSPDGVVGGPRAAASGASAPTEEFSLQGGVLAPKPDSERIHQEFWAFAAYYGDGFSKKLTADEWGGVMLAQDGRLTLPLKVRMARGYADDGSDANWIDDQTGLQVRLVHHYGDAENDKLYRYCDALTTAPLASGQNAVFTGLDMHQGGSLEVFLVDPVDHTKNDATLNLIPTPDFSAACIGMSPDAYNVWQRSQIKLGDILLLAPLIEGTAPSNGVGPDEIIVIPDAGTPETPSRPKTVPNIPLDMILRKP